MGGGKGGGISTSGPSPEQRETQKFFLESVSKPLADVLIPQMLEAITTGGIGAKIPIAQKAVEQSRLATSRALTDISTSLTRAGQRKTPFGERTLAATRLAGETDIANIPIEIAQALAAIAPDLISGGGRISVSGPGVSKGRTPGADATGSLFEAGGNIGAALIAAKALPFLSGCWIAAAIYGENTPQFYLARYWIMFAWKGKAANVVRWLYFLVGPSLAPLVKRSSWLKSTLKPIFDVAVRRSLAYLIGSQHG